MLTSHHSLGLLSDKVFHTLESVVPTSFQKKVYLSVTGSVVYISTSFKEFIPLVGNRVCLDARGRKFYLQINSQGQLINKIRLL